MSSHNSRSEASYTAHDVIPLFESLGYPGTGDHQRVRINDVPMYRPSGGRSGATMDIVYYQENEPVLLVEAKRKHKTHEAALKEAENYMRNFPKQDKEFAPSGRAPVFIATTVGGDIRFYRHSFSIESGQLIQESKPLLKLLSFDALVTDPAYGLSPDFKPMILNASGLTENFLNELLAVFVPYGEKEIKPKVIYDITQLLLAYLRSPSDYTHQSPYIDLHAHRDRQRHIVDLFRRFDIAGSLGAESAQAFREFILRAFQGSKNFNQYITPWSVIAFMTNMSNIQPQDTVLDFECGSGGYLSAALQKCVPLNNIKGVDVDQLPYAVSKLYLAMYSQVQGREMDNLPLILGNGLFDHGNNWSVVIGNPAGGKKYDPHEKLNDIKKVYARLEKDLDQNEKDDSASEYNFSIQQAVRSAKVGGRICLILPEGVFSNANTEFLRKYIAKYCTVKAIVSLPRGAFHEGTTTKTVKSGKQAAGMKMSILFLVKTAEVVDRSGVDIAGKDINYPVFLTSVAEKPKSFDVNEYLNWVLHVVYDEYRSWEQTRELLVTSEPLLAAKTGKKSAKKKKREADLKRSITIAQSNIEEVIKKPQKTEEAIIPDEFNELF